MNKMYWKMRLLFLINNELWQIFLFDWKKKQNPGKQHYLQQADANP